MRATSWLHRSEAELGRTGCPQRECSRDTLRTNLDSPPTDAFRTRGALDLAPPPQHVDSTSSYRVPARKLSFPDGDLPEATRAWGMLRLRGDPLLSLQDGRSFLRCTGDVHQGFTGWPVGLTTPTSTMVPAALPRPNQPSHDGQTDRQTHTNFVWHQHHDATATPKQASVALARPELPRLPQHHDRLPEGRVSL